MKIERQKLEKQLQKIQENLNHLESLMKTPHYKEKVRPEIQARDNERRAKLEAELHQVKKTLMTLSPPE